MPSRKGNLTSTPLSLSVGIRWGGTPLPMVYPGGITAGGFCEMPAIINPVESAHNMEINDQERAEIRLKATHPEFVIENRDRRIDELAIMATASLARDLELKSNVTADPKAHNADIGFLESLHRLVHYIDETLITDTASGMGNFG